VTCAFGLTPWPWDSGDKHTDQPAVLQLNGTLHPRARLDADGVAVGVENDVSYANTAPSEIRSSFR